jgi:hypothetical protein
VKRSKKKSISFRFEPKQSEKRLFHFALKRNKKIGSEMKRNKKILEAKQSELTSSNFVLVGREKFEAKRSKNIFFCVSVRHACETDLVSL